MVRHSASIRTPLGQVRVTWEGGWLSGIDLEPAAADEANAEVLPEPFARELDAYFRDGRHRFDLPLRLEGTPFQRRVWEELRVIPPGRAVTYGQLARQLHSSPRAVGGACRANPCAIVVPCHRVVAADGLGGFAGDRSGRKLAVKRWLLRHEGVKALAGLVSYSAP